MKLSNINLLFIFCFLFCLAPAVDKEQALETFAEIDADLSLNVQSSAQLQAQIDKISMQIVLANSELVLTKDRIKSLKTELANLLYISYFNLDKLSKLTYILSASDFATAYHRYLLIDQLVQYRNEQISVFKTYTAHIISLDSTLQVLKNRELKMFNLAQDKIVTNKALQQQYDQLAKALLDDREKYIELQKERNILHATETSEAINRITLYNTKLTENKAYVFSANNKVNMGFYRLKGKLEPPVKASKIVERFGERNHPVLAEVKVRNDGVTLKATAGSSVCCVYDGVVVNVYNIQGSQHTVLVAHGDYFTLYSNLESVLVQAGDELMKGQKIGSLSAGSVAYMRFQIWKGKSRLNPEKWLK